MRGKVTTALPVAGTTREASGTKLGPGSSKTGEPTNWRDRSNRKTLLLKDLHGAMIKKSTLNFSQNAKFSSSYIKKIKTFILS